MLPSDIARLVLIYLRDEGLNRSFKLFFRESPHLEELRQHPDVEPSVAHGKCLADVLNEYVKMCTAVRDRMSCNQVVDSLWKQHREVIGQLRFHYTGNAGVIQSQASSPETICIDQRGLTRMRMASLRRQQERQRKMAAITSSLTTVPSANGPMGVQVDAERLLEGASGETPVGVVGPPSPQMVASGQVLDPESPISLELPITPAKNHSIAQVMDTTTGKSPKRKSTAPRRMLATAAASSSSSSSIPTRCYDNPITTSSSSSTSASALQREEQRNDLPQVLESLINNTAFQETLAGNINRALPGENRSEPVQEPVGGTGAPPTSTSIDDLLNLHMNEDTIQEIVQNTSTDPAFESLFSLFSLDAGQNGQVENLHPTRNDPPDTRPDDQSHTRTSPSPLLTHLPTDQSQMSDVSAQSNELTAEGGQLTPATATTAPNHVNPDGVMTVPLVINSPGQYQPFQAATANALNAPSPTVNIGGTIFMSTDGRILGTSGVVLPNGPPLPSCRSIEGVGTSEVGAGNEEEAPGVTTRDESQLGKDGSAGKFPDGTNEAATASVEFQSDAVQLLGSMVESDVGSLFCSSPETDRPFRCVASETKLAGSSCKTPLKETSAAKAKHNRKKNVVQHDSGESAFAAIGSKEDQTLTGSTTTAEVYAPIEKPRKSIQFRGPVLPRNLDFGTQCQVNIGGTVQASGHDNDGATPTGVSYPKQRTSRPAKTVTQQRQKRDKSDTVVTPGDMSTEVNIAAQMLVSLSNSPPSVRQSLLRSPKRRTESARSPLRNPTQAYVTELRREIGLNPSVIRSALTAESMPSASAAVSSIIADDTKGKKRKSRTPRKQTAASTETVVLAVPTNNHRKTPNADGTLEPPDDPAAVVEDGPGRATRKSSRNIKSPGKLGGEGDWVTGKGAWEKGNDVAGQSGKKKALKRTRGKADTLGNKKAKTTKNSKKTKTMEGFPSNLDVDKFLSSLEYLE